MLTEKDIGERVVCKEWRGRLEAVNGGTITVDIGPDGTWIGSVDGWTLAGPVNESAPATRLRKLAEILSATSTETMPSPAGLRSAARLLVAIAAEIEDDEAAVALAHVCADCGIPARGTWGSDRFCAEHMRSALEAEDLHGPPAG